MLRDLLQKIVLAGHLHGVLQAKRTQFDYYVCLEVVLYSKNSA